MKSNITSHKQKLAREAENSLPRLMVEYESGDLSSLGKLCNAINVLAEFYADNPDSEFAKRVPRLINYLNDKFEKCVVLVLKKGEKHFGYTANNVTKFVRGESLHGASENRDAKRKTLHDFVFEKSTKTNASSKLAGT